MPKLSIIIPVYYNYENLEPLYLDLKSKILDTPKNFETEVIMVDDGSKDLSWEKMQELAIKDSRIKIYKLSRNFGSHAAILCGLSNCTGDCAVVKAADLQEPTELIIEMYDSWEQGNNIVLATREGREEKKSKVFFANLYYTITRKLALPNMPKNGFDIYLLDRKVITVLELMDEKESALTGQILWCGFQTSEIHYVRLDREIGKSRWTFRKKIKLVTDTLFNFSTVPISLITFIGVVSFLISLIWAIVLIISKLMGYINVSGWTSLFIFSLFSFGVIMITLGILGGYLWRAFSNTLHRPVYIVENSSVEKKAEEKF